MKMEIKPNIYYAGAMSQAPSEFKDTAKHAIDVLNKYGSVLSEHVITQTEIQRTRDQEQNVNIVERDLGLINLSDLCVADFSYASTGTGMEILNCLSLRYIPVLAVQKKGTPGTNMIRNLVHPNLTWVQYYDEQHLSTLIDNYMRSFPKIKPAYEKFVMIDSIDGAGKGAIMDALEEWATSHQLKTWDLSKFDETQLTSKQREQVYCGVPSWDLVKKDLCPGIDVLMVREPTFNGMGKIIREVLTSKHNFGRYSSRTVAHAFGIDREIIYNHLMGPALKEGVFGESDRGNITSFVYQPTMARDNEGWSEEMFLGYVRGLPGNQYAIDHSPGLIVVPQVSAKEAMRRLEAREEKDDESAFENIKFQEAIAEIYRGDRISGFYNRRGSQVTDLVQELGEGPEDTKRKAKEIWNNYLEEKGIQVGK